MFLDKRGGILQKFQTVEVGKPRKDDLHHFSFVGTIIDVLENRGTVIVEDMDGDTFEVDANNVEIMLERLI